MATVLGNGHAASLMRVRCVEGHPQIHLHLLSDPKEVKELGFEKMELCCHGCGGSKLLTFNHFKDPAVVRARDAFSSKHFDCPNRDYANRCPDIRLSIEVVDLRGAITKQEATACES